MALINLREINDYIRNLYSRVGLEDLQEFHASRIREWFIENMSNVGRYANRDFEKFGSLNTARPTNNNIQKRQDGWQSVTEEVPDIDHITYGTGILYIHGEMEVPRSETAPGNQIVNDEYCHVSKNDTQHFQVAVGGEQKGAFNETQDGSNVIQGYKWNFSSETPTGDENSDNWFYDTIIETVAAPKMSSYNKSWTPQTMSSATATTPAVFNDAQIYHIDNERNHYPFIIINSGQPASINTLLQSLNGKNGMYDNTVPAIATATGTYPPISGIEITDGSRVSILDYISPLNETPNGNP